MSERQHGWSKLRLGQKWNAIALDFGRIQSVMRLGEYERMLVWAIQEFSWDHSDRRRRSVGRWPGPRPFVMPLGELAKLIDPADKGYLRKKLYEARASLMKDSVVQEEGGGLLVNTDVEAWTGDRLRPCHVAYGLAARTRAKAPESEADDQGLLPFPEDADASSASTDDVSFQEDKPVLLKGHIEGSKNTNISSQEDTDILLKGQTYPPKRISEAGAIEDRGREFRDLESSKELNSSLPPAANGHLITPTPGRTPGDLSVPGSDSPEALALAQRITAAYGPLPGHMARQWCDDIPVEWIEVGFRRRVRGRAGMTEKRIVDLLGAIFESWRSAGACDLLDRPVDTGPPEAPTNGPAPTREPFLLPSLRAQIEERDRLMKPELAALILNGSKPHGS